MPAITLPDGSVRRFDAPVTGTALAAAIGPGLARAALAMAVDGTLQDLARPIEHDASVRFVTRRDPEALGMIRHDTAHVLAEAVQALYPGTQVTIGPSIENGFYYDFARNQPFTPEEFGAIEARMREIVARNAPFERQVWDRDDAIRFFEARGERFKAELIRDLPGTETITLYKQGDWIDLCRGPHMRGTGDVGTAFKLMKVAGAYWRGDHRNPVLSRIYGTAWRDQKELDAHLLQLEEAERRDHRRVGRDMDLFHIQEEATGSVFWHPKGWTLYRAAEDYMRRRLNATGYQEVRTPQLVDRKLWEASGHWDNYKENMFIARVEDEDTTLALKPMNCPCHVLIFRDRLRSYRELPLRMAEFGSCHRYEPSGALHGIMRVRAFTQDDAHIFCTEAQIADETVRFVALLSSVYRDFGFDSFRVKFSDRPATRAGDDATWDRAEGALQEACAIAGVAYEPNPGEGRVLRPEARVRAARRHRAGLAVRHAAGGLRAARAARRCVYRGGQRPRPARHAAPGHIGQLRTVPGHLDRAVCRAVPALAGARPGGGRQHRVGRGRLCRGGGGVAGGARPAGRRRHAQREDQCQGARAQLGACPGPAGRGPARGGGANRGDPPPGQRGAGGAAARRRHRSFGARGAGPGPETS